MNRLGNLKKQNKASRGGLENLPMAYLVSKTDLNVSLGLFSLQNPKEVVLEALKPRL